MLRRQPRRRRNAGFTLIEVLMAFVLSTVGLLGALMLTLSLLTGSTFSRHLTEASTLAQSKLEAINSQVITSTSPADGYSVTEPSSGQLLDAYGNQSATGEYTRVTTWSTVTVNTLSRRHIEVDVYWNDAAGKRHDVYASEDRIP